MQPDAHPRRPRRPTFTRRELTLMALGLACVVGQVIVYRGPESGTAARVAVVVLGLGAFGFIVSWAVVIVRRGLAQRHERGTRTR